MEQRKEFTGVWIPRHIIEDENLSWTEIILYSEIASYSKGCFKSLESLAKRLRLSHKTKVSPMLKKLEERGYIICLHNDGRQKHWLITGIPRPTISEIKERRTEFEDKVAHIKYTEQQNQGLGVTQNGNLELPKKVTHTILDNNIDNIFAKQVLQTETLQTIQNKRMKLKTKEAFNPKTAVIIKTFAEKIDPQNKDFMDNSTQRKASQFLIDNYGFQETLDFIDFVSKNLKNIFNPPKTPFELKKEWVRVVSEVGYKINKQETKKPKISYG